MAVERVHALLRLTRVPTADAPLERILMCPLPPTVPSSSTTVTPVMARTLRVTVFLARTVFDGLGPPLLCAPLIGPLRAGWSGQLSAAPLFLCCSPRGHTAGSGVLGCLTAVPVFPNFFSLRGAAGAMLYVVSPARVHVAIPHRHSHRVLRHADPSSISPYASGCLWPRGSRSQARHCRYTPGCVAHFG